MRKALVILIALLACPLTATAGTLNIGPFPNFKGFGHPEVTITIHSHNEEDTVGVCALCNDDATFTFPLPIELPIFEWTYYGLHIVGDPVVEGVRVVEIFGKDLNPTGDPTTIPPGTGFDPFNPEAIPVGPNRLNGLSGTVYSVPWLTSTVANLPSVLPEFNLSQFTADPNSIVYVADSGVLPAVDFVCPEPGTLTLLCLSLLAVIGYSTMRLHRAQFREGIRMSASRMSEVWKIEMPKTVTSVVFVLASIFIFLMVPRDAHAAFTPPPFEPEASAAYLIRCAMLDGFDCAIQALIVDPVGIGITNISIDIKYNAQLVSFNSSESGFLCQFSSTGDCPPPMPSVGKTPVHLLPPMGFTPGSPLPGSTVSLTDTGTEVHLQYMPGEPVIADTDTNFFLFAFDFKSPTKINVGASTATYLDGPPGADFTLSSFACSTTQTPNGGCGSSPGTGTTGITLNLVPVPEPGTWLVTFAGVLMVFGYCGWRVEDRMGRRKLLRGGTRDFQVCRKLVPPSLVPALTTTVGTRYLDKDSSGRGTIPINSSTENLYVL